MNKHIFLGLIVLASHSAFAGDCSFKFSKSESQGAGDAVVYGIEKTSVGNVFFDKTAGILESKGYSHRVKNPSQTADIEIKTSIWSVYISDGNKYDMGVKVSISDTKNSEVYSKQFYAGMYRTRRVLRNLNRILENLPEEVGQMVPDCKQ